MTLTKIEDLVADNELRCDASADLVNQLVKNNDSSFRGRHLPVAYQVKFCKITKGQKYKRYEMVDEDCEVHEFKCVLRLDDYMIRNELYPEFLLEQIKKINHAS